MALYELAIMGSPSDGERDSVTRLLVQFIEPFGLRLGEEVGLTICHDTFNPPQTTTAAAVFFGRPGIRADGLPSVLQKGIPVIPIASAEGRFASEMPDSIQPLNG